MEHFQGYLECIGKKSMKQLHEIPGLERAHFEVRRGSGAQAIAYATKMDTRVDGPWYYGEPKEQGKRSDLEDIKKMVEKRAPLVDIWDSHFGSMVRYHKSIKEYKRIKTAYRTEFTRIIIIIGKSGVGKSRLARQMARTLTGNPITSGGTTMMDSLMWSGTNLLDSILFAICCVSSIARLFLLSRRGQPFSSRRIWLFSPVIFILKIGIILTLWDIVGTTALLIAVFVNTVKLFIFLRSRVDTTIILLEYLLF